MWDFFKEVFISMKEKVSSPFLRYFAFSWVITNYKFVYIFLFQDDALFLKHKGMLKIEYLTTHYFSADLAMNFLWCVFFFLLIPICSALFFIYIFPEWNNAFLKQYQDNINEEEELKQKHRINDIKREMKRNDERLENKKIEFEVKETEKKIEDVWKDDAIKQDIEDYLKLKKTNMFLSFDKITDVINLQKKFREYGSGHYRYILSEEIVNQLIWLWIAHINKEDSDYLAFTEKWKKFSELYHNDKIW